MIKTSAMARAPITAVMKSKYFVRLADQGKLPKTFSDQYTSDPKNFFIVTRHLEHEYPDLTIGKDIPWGAFGLYSYLIDRIGEGLKQIQAGSRKFKLDLLERSDILSLSEYAAKVTGIPTFEQRAREVIPGILAYWGE